MKIMYQLFIILLFTLLGEFISYLLPFNFPGSIIGLLLMFLALLLNILKVKHVFEVSLWLQQNMAFLFTPLAVGVMNYFDILKLKWFEFLIVTTISTLITLIITALIAKVGEENG